MSECGGRGHVGRKRLAPKDWPRSDVEYLEHAWPHRTAREIAKALGRSTKSVNSKIERLRHAELRKLIRCGYSPAQAKHMIEGYVYEG